MIQNAPGGSIWSGARAPPMSCPLIEEDSLLKLEMLDVAEKDPVAPAPTSAPSSPSPDPEEEEQGVQIPEEYCASELEEATHSEGGLDLVWVIYLARPLGFACSWLA